jgi:hypothetical protein
MNAFAKHAVILIGVAVVAMVALAAPPREGQAAKPPPSKAPSTLEEARAQARLLHDFVHATLQVVHTEYYREDERLPLPANAFETVFEEMAGRSGVKLKWLAVNAKAMNIDHEPRDEFEKQAVAALAAGKDEYESVGPDLYRHAGPITLFSQCLKCHLPSRSSNKERLAALVINVKLKTP